MDLCRSPAYSSQRKLQTLHVAAGPMSQHRACTIRRPSSKQMSRSLCLRQWHRLNFSRPALSSPRFQSIAHSCVSAGRTCPPLSTPQITAGPTPPVSISGARTASLGSAHGLSVAAHRRRRNSSVTMDRRTRSSEASSNGDRLGRETMLRRPSTRSTRQASVGALVSQPLKRTTRTSA